jgi:hypothetical protein
MVTPACEAFVTPGTAWDWPRYHGAMVALLPLLRRAVSLCALVSAVLMSGCAAVAGPPLPDDIAACQRWLERLDEQVDAHAVRDGSAARLPAWRFLRVDRLLASYRNEAVASEAAWAAWGRRMVALDELARTAETRNLPPVAMVSLGVGDAQAAMERVRACAPRLWARLAADPGARARLQQAAQVPDDYSPVLRGLGLYALTRWPFFAGVEREQRHWQVRWNRAALPEHAGGTPIRYRPAAPDPAAGTTDIGDPLRRLPLDALGIPEPDAATAQRLLAAYAPVIDIDTVADHDRPGRLSWGASPAPEVNPREPVLYQRIAHTRLGGRARLQLVYSLWFPERPARSGLDLLAGRVDAVVLRLTLDERGRVLMLDSIHGCGCYHVFVPGQSMTLRPAPDPQTEWAFVPAQLPALRPGQRLRVHIAAVDHQLVGVGADAGATGDAVKPAASYALLDEDSLRSLPTSEGGHRSAFWSSGIMPGTERGERALFWPMGIASPGAMRQWGRHPTAFVGRRHFDDPHLLAERFEEREQPGER